MKIVGYQIILRITRFVTLVIRPDYQKFCLRSTPGNTMILGNETNSFVECGERTNSMQICNFGEVAKVDSICTI